MSEQRFEKIIWDEVIPVDVRSPQEFQKGHIEGAMNVPILDNIARSKVGTIYKQKGQDAAIELGFTLVDFLAIYQALKEIQSTYVEKKILIYCARGGMRSGIVYHLMQALNISCSKLIGGYKAYRHEILSLLNEGVDQFKFLILNGYTGSGKTIILNKLNQSGGFSIDLEGLASHAGSVFGHIPFGERQTVTQQQFESGLAHKLLEAKQRGIKTIILEGESRRIGRVVLPAPFFNQMKQSKTVIVERSLEQRVELIMEQYAPGSPWFMEALSRLKRQLGDHQYRTLCNMIESGREREVVESLLTQYYDRCYQHAIGDKREIISVLSGSDHQIIEQLLKYQSL